MDYRVAYLDDIDNIVAFHKKEFKDYYLTQLGDFTLMKYYSEFLASTSNKCFLCLDQNQNIAGLALFVLDFDEFISKFYKKNIWVIGSSICKSLLKFNPVVWGGTFDRLVDWLSTDSSGISFPRLTLLSLAVSSSYRRHGIASQLLTIGEKYYVDNGFSSYYLSVKSDNLGGILFYQKHDFYTIGLYKDLVYMEKKICPK